MVSPGLTNLLLQDLSPVHPSLVARCSLDRFGSAFSTHLRKHSRPCGLGVWRLFQPSLILPHEREDLIETLQSLSQTYAHHLPVICTSAMHEFWSHLPKSTIDGGWRLPNRIQPSGFVAVSMPTAKHV